MLPSLHKSGHPSGRSIDQLAAIPTAVQSAVAALSFLSFLLTALGCATAVSQAPPLLQADQPVSDSIAEGENRIYRLELQAESFVKIYVRQEGIDLRAVLVDPQGRTVAIADGPGGANGNELLVARTARTGEHRVLVAPRSPGGRGRLVIGLLERRAATGDDDARISGLRALARGSQLYSQKADAQRRKEALDAYREAASYFRQIDDPLNLAWALLYTARSHLSFEAWSPARQAAHEAARLFEVIGAGEAYVSALSNLAQAQEGLEELDQALETFDTTVAYYRNEVQTAADENARRHLYHSLAVDLNNRGRLLTSQGKLHRAEADYLEAEQIWRQIGGHVSDQITALLNLGKVYRLQGRLERAFHLYEEGALLVDDEGARFNEAHLLNNLGRYYLATGDLKKASESLNHGLDLARELGNTRVMQATTQNLGILAEVVGDYEGAAEYFRRSLELSQSIGLPSLLSESFIHLGRSQAGSGLNAQSLTSFRQAQTFAVRAESVPLEVASVREIATIQARSGNPAEGLRILQETESTWPRLPEALRSAVLRTKAEILQRLGDSRKALDVLYEALDLHLALQDNFERGAVLVQLATLERAEGLTEPALEHLESVLELHERIRSKVTTPELRASFLARRRSHYLELVDLLLEMEARQPGQGHAIRALEVSERSRARTLVELLTEARVQVRKGIPDHLRRREGALLTRLSLLHGELLQLEHGDDTDEKLAISLQNRLRETMESYKWLEGEIRRSWSGYASLRYPETVNLEQIQAFLPENSSLLQYVLGPERSFLFLVQPRRFDVHVLPNRATIESHVETIRQLLQRGDPRSQLRFDRATRVLHDILISPVESALLDTPQVWVVPDGNLFYLPFEILRGQNGKPLLDKVTLTYVPSATVLASLDDRSSVPRRPAFVGFAGALGSEHEVGLHTLPGTVQEVQSIAELFPQESTVYIGEAANQGHVFDNPLVSSARWLHFASHGLIREDAPLQSAILLSPDSRGDALLQAAEIFDLRIGCELVVLSACETGLGSAVRGEGLIGLSRAFFYAGTANVLVSLWRVEDSTTATLMRLFYRRLRAGDSPNEALRQAKIALIEESGNRDPRIWAPFVLLGRGA